MAPAYQGGIRTPQPREGGLDREGKANAFTSLLSVPVSCDTVTH